MKHEAKQLVRDFIAEMLNGDVKNLKDFDFKTLKESEKFGCPDWNFDCDDTRIMRSIYVVLWGDLFPGLAMNNFGYCRQYRGDTMNSFHTLFGRELPHRKGFYAGLEKYLPSDELREKVRHFSVVCSSVGNYAVLPNYYAEGTTLNCYRGTNEWHDFFDRFLMELYKVLTHAPDQDKTLQKLVSVNDFGFTKFRSHEGFRAFSQGLLLQDYCSEEGRPVQIFPMNYHWKDEKDPDQYFHDVLLYLEKAEKIIKKRSGMICKLLERKLFEE